MKIPSSGFKFTVHPLFLLFGLIEGLRGRLFSFLSVTIVAILHELGHSLYARSIGYSLDKICLMPYGATVRGEVFGLSRKETVLLCLAGPLTNGLVCLCFVALWWLFPETYPYTDTAVFSSAAVGLVNLLPALPLDGGRALFCLIGKPVRFFSYALSALCLVFGLLLCNLSLFFFGLFLLFGEKEGVYERLDFSLSEGLLHGVRVKEILISGEATLKSVFRFLRKGDYLVLTVSDGRETLGTLTQNELYDCCLKYGNTANLRQILAEKGKKAQKNSCKNDMRMI